MSDVQQAIDHLAHGNGSEFQDTVNSILMSRVRERLDNEKYAVAQSVFGSNEQEEVADEDV